MICGNGVFDEDVDVKSILPAVNSSSPFTSPIYLTAERKKDHSYISSSKLKSWLESILRNNEVLYPIHTSLIKSPSPKIGSLSPLSSSPENQSADLGLSSKMSTTNAFPESVHENDKLNQPIRLLSLLSASPSIKPVIIENLSTTYFYLATSGPNQSRRRMKKGVRSNNNNKISRELSSNEMVMATTSASSTGKILCFAIFFLSFMIVYA
jgi:hypothetical protein